MFDIKKYIMRQFWRFQQIQLMLGLVFYALTLTGVFYIDAGGPNRVAAAARTQYDEHSICPILSLRMIWR